MQQCLVLKHCRESCRESAQLCQTGTTHVCIFDKLPEIFHLHNINNTITSWYLGQKNTTFPNHFQRMTVSSWVCVLWPVKLGVTPKLEVYSETWSLHRNLEFTPKLGVIGKLGVYSEPCSLLRNLELLVLQYLEFIPKLGVS